MATPQEKPVKVRRYRSEGHAMETRIFARNIHETFCVQDGCRFKGKHAAQGICHTRLKAPDQRYLERVNTRAQGMLKELRDIRTQIKMNDAKYIDYLERHILCDWMNHEFGLDELIRLRGLNAELRLKDARRKS